MSPKPCRYTCRRYAGISWIEKLLHPVISMMVGYCVGGLTKEISLQESSRSPDVTRQLHATKESA